MTMLAPIALASRTISFRSDLNIMVVRWHTHAPHEVVKEEYARMLTEALHHGLTYWLLDVRRRDKTPVDLSNWVNMVFYPEVAKQLAPRRLRMAVLGSPALTEAYRTDPERKRKSPTRWTLPAPLTSAYSRTREKPWDGSATKAIKNRVSERRRRRRQSSFRTSIDPEGFGVGGDGGNA